jgi:hypothetical protein
MKFLLAFIFLFSQTTFGQTVGRNIEFNSVSGADYYTNFVINESAKKNTANTVTSNATVARGTTNKIDNVASFTVDASAQNGYVEFTLGTVYDPATSGNCEFKGVFKGDGTLYRAQIVDGSGNLLNQTRALTNETSWRPFSVTYPCAASGSRKVRITQTEAGTAPAFSVGKLYYGQITNLQAGVPNNVFTAQVSSAGAVSAENEDFISGNISYSSPLYTLTYTSGKFSSSPTCTLQLTPGEGSYYSSFVVTRSSTQLVYGFRNSSGTGTQVSHDLICTRSSTTDFIQPAITADQWDFGETPYTPVITGLGSGSATTIASYSRNGSYINICIQITKDATNGTGSSIVEATLPTGITVNTSGWTGGVKFGTGWSSINSSNVALAIDSAYNKLYFYFGSAVTVGSSYTSSSTTRGCIMFPASQNGTPWTTNQNAPQLVGSVTSNSSSALRIESLYVNVSCTSTPCTTSTSMGTQGWFSSVSRNSTGNYTVNIKSGVFRIAPICFGNANTGGSGSDSTVALDTASTTSQIVYTRNAGTFTDLTFFLTCIGPR